MSPVLTKLLGTPSLSPSEQRLNLANKAGSHERTTALRKAAYCRFLSGRGIPVGLAILEISSFCSGVRILTLAVFPPLESSALFAPEVGGDSCRVATIYRSQKFIQNAPLNNPTIPYVLAAAGASARASVLKDLQAGHRSNPLHGWWWRWRSGSITAKELGLATSRGGFEQPYHNAWLVFSICINDSRI